MTNFYVQKMVVTDYSNGESGNRFFVAKEVIVCESGQTNSETKFKVNRINPE